MFRPIALVATLLVACTDPGPAPDSGADSGADTDTAEPIVAGTETVSTSWDVDLFSMYESPTIARFDTLGGRRQLDGMVIAVDHAASMTVSLENASDFPLVAADYSAEYYLQSIIQLGVENADEEGEDSPPFFGPGSFLGVFAVDLAASDGTERGGSDYYVETVSDDIQFEAPYDPIETPTYLEAMTGTDEIQLVVGGFSELWIYWNNYDDGSALLDAGATAVQYSGTMTVTYAFSPTEE